MSEDSFTPSVLLRERIEQMGWPPFGRDVGYLLLDIVEAAEDTDYATDPEWPLQPALAALQSALEKLA